MAGVDVTENGGESLVESVEVLAHVSIGQEGRIRLGGLGGGRGHSN